MADVPLLPIIRTIGRNPSKHQRSPFLGTHIPWTTVRG
ncbi:MAG: hypothetical protein OJF47_004022 [Nitrospira sp.]|nr:MAG: hypothetical protein OJF47_004022 [Nitrospira sp.]